MKLVAYLIGAIAIVYGFSIAATLILTLMYALVASFFAVVFG